MPSDIGVTIRELMRYGYAGLLAFLTAAIASPDESKKVFDALGPVLAPLVAIAVGGGVYSIYKTLLNELLLDPFANLLHRLVHSLHRWKTGQTTNESISCTVLAFEERYHVPRGRCLDAWRLIRDSDLMRDFVREKFHLQHNETHVVHLTGVVLATAVAYKVIRMSSEPLPAGWCAAMLASVACFFVGTIADIHICRQQCSLLLTFDKSTVERLLEGAELSKKR